MKPQQNYCLINLYSLAIWLHAIGRLLSLMPKMVDWITSFVRYLAIRFSFLYFYCCHVPLILTNQSYGKFSRSSKLCHVIVLKINESQRGTEWRGDLGRSHVVRQRSKRMRQGHTRNFTKVEHIFLHF